MSPATQGAAAHPESPAVIAEGVGRRFGRNWALAHVELTVTQGEVVLLAGANGSGKTTLLRLIAGLMRPSAGRLAVFGLDPVNHRAEHRQAISLISHASYLYGLLSARETIGLWARLLGRPEDEQAIASLLDEVGLADRADRPVAGFSAGMRKRLSLARVLLERPRLVLLDEPFAALDAAGKQLIETWVERFRSSGTTVLMASHALARAGNLADHGILLSSGQVVFAGAGHELAQRAGEVA